MEFILIVCLVVSIGLLMYGSIPENSHIAYTIVGFLGLMLFMILMVGTSMYKKNNGIKTNVVISIKNIEVRSTYMSNDTTYVIIK